MYSGNILHYGTDEGRAAHYPKLGIISTAQQYGEHKVGGVARGGEYSGTLLGLIERRLVAHNGTNVQARKKTNDRHARV